MTMYCAGCGVQLAAGADFCQKCGAQVAIMPDPGIRVTSVAPTGITIGAPAGIWVRYAAKLVDWVIIFAGFLVLVIALFFLFSAWPMKQISEENSLILGLFLFVGFYSGWVIYNSLMHGTWGQTVGKMMLGIKVLRNSGQPVGYGRAFARTFAEFLSGLLLSIGYLMAVFSAQKRSLHDLICDTIVVRVRPIMVRDKVIVSLGVVLLVLSFVGAVNDSVDKFAAYRKRGYDSEAKSNLKNAATAEETFFTGNSQYTSSLSDLTYSGFKTDPEVRIALLPGEGSLTKNYIVIARHIRSEKAFVFSTTTGKVEEITVQDLRKAGVTGLDP